LAASEDGSLFALTNGYGRAVSFDPKSETRTSLGETMSVYSLLPFEQKLCLCGYAGSMVWIYDPAQPWTAGKAGGTPKEKEAGGIHDPFEMFPIYWMCSAAEGRYILCSTKAVAAAGNPDVVPPRGRLFVYDTTTHEIVHQADDERLGPYPGFIVEALPGVVTGYTLAKDSAGIESGLLYGFDPAAAGAVEEARAPAPRHRLLGHQERPPCLHEGARWSFNRSSPQRGPDTARVPAAGRRPGSPCPPAGGGLRRTRPGSHRRAGR
jgi:hypothetical protein